MAVFPGEPGSASSPVDPPHPPVPEEDSWRLVEWVFLQVRCPSCHPAISVKAPMKTQSTNPNHWPGLILSSSTTGLLTEKELFHYASFLTPVPDMPHETDHILQFSVGLLWYDNTTDQWCRNLDDCIQVRRGNFEFLPDL